MRGYQGLPNTEMQPAFVVIDEVRLESFGDRKTKNFHESDYSDMHEYCWSKGLSNP